MVIKSNASNRFTCCVLGGILVSVVRVCNAAVSDGKICSEKCNYAVIGRAVNGGTVHGCMC